MGLIQINNTGSIKKRFWIVTALFAPFFFVGLLSFVLYVVVHSPEHLTPAVEWGLSRLLNSPVRVGRAEILKNPFGINLSQLHVRFGATPDNIIRINNVNLHLSLLGPLGSRTLWIDRLAIEKAQAQINFDIQLPDILSPQSSKSSPGFLDGIFSEIVFKNVRLKSAALSDSSFVGRRQGQRFTFSRINFQLDDTSRVTGSMLAAFEDPEQGIELPRTIINMNANLSDSQAEKGLWGNIQFAADRIIAKETMLSSVKGRVDIEYISKNKFLYLKKTNLNSVVESLPKASLQGMLPRPTEIEFSGGMDLTNGRLQDGTWRVTVDNLLMLQGAADARWKDAIGYEVRLIEGWLSMHPINLLLRENIHSKLLRLDDGQKIDLHGNAAIRPDQETYQLSGMLDVSLHRNRYTLQYQDVIIKGALDGNLRIEGAWPGTFAYAGQLENYSAHISASTFNLDDLQANLQFEGRYPEIRLKDFSLGLSSVTLPLSSRQLNLADVKIQADDAQWNFKGASGQLPALRIASNLFKTINIGVNYDENTAAVSIQANESGVVDALRELKILPSDWHIKAQEALKANFLVDWKAHSMGWQVRLDLNALEVENPDQSLIGEKLGVMLEGNGALDLKDFGTVGRIGLDCVSGEMLFDRFYLNFKDHPLNFKAKIEQKASGGSIALSDGTFSLGGLVRTAFDFQHRSLGQAIGTRLKLSFPATDIQPLFNFGLKEPFELENPALAAAQVAGTIAADIDMAFKEKDWEVKGRCKWQNGILALKEKKISLGGIQLDFPFWMASESSAPNVAPLNGELAIGAMTVPHLAQQPISLPLAVSPNHVSISAATSLQTEGGGTIHLWPVSIAYPSGEELAIDTRLKIDNWHFDAGLSRWWPSQGPVTINATLDPVQVRGQRLTSKGELWAKLFGGLVKVKDPNVTGLFGSMPAFGLDVTLQELNLAALTNETSFGQVDGILNGQIDQLEIVNKQPQRFALRLETVRQKGISQKISVKAVESIARIGGGQSPFMGLAGQFAALFKKFRYRKIGVLASLQNDMFKVNGLIQEKGREYVVKKSGLSGVDVVNSNPDNRIGFKDMVKRIRRVLSSNTQPVVK